MISVGMAALEFPIGAGGLGESSNPGRNPHDDDATFIGAALVPLLALATDRIAALTERYPGPTGV